MTLGCADPSTTAGSLLFPSKRTLSRVAPLSQTIIIATHFNKAHYKLDTLYFSTPTAASRGTAQGGRDASRGRRQLDILCSPRAGVSSTGDTMYGGTTNLPNTQPPCSVLLPLCPGGPARLYRTIVGSLCGVGGWGGTTKKEKKNTFLDLQAKHWPYSLRVRGPPTPHPPPPAPFSNQMHYRLCASVHPRHGCRQCSSHVP